MELRFLTLVEGGTIGRRTMDRCRPLFALRQEDGANSQLYWTH